MYWFSIVLNGCTCVCVRRMFYVSQFWNTWNENINVCILRINTTHARHSPGHFDDHTTMGKLLWFVCTYYVWKCLCSNAHISTCDKLRSYNVQHIRVYSDTNMYSSTAHSHTSACHVSSLLCFVIIILCVNLCGGWINTLDDIAFIANMQYAA